MTHTRTIVREFLARHTGGRQIADDVDVFDTGLVNSLFAVQIVMWVGRTFDVSILQSDLDMSNFRSIESIVDFVARKQG